MKIVATVSDHAAQVFGGGGAEQRSAVIELPEPLPKIVRDYLKTRKWASECESRNCYEQLSFSILEDPEGEKA